MQINYLSLHTQCLCSVATMLNKILKPVYQFYSLLCYDELLHSVSPIY